MCQTPHVILLPAPCLILVIAAENAITPDQHLLSGRATQVCQLTALLSATCSALVHCPWLASGSVLISYTNTSYILYMDKWRNQYNFHY